MRNGSRAQDWVALVPWISRFDINYAIGVDGISLALILLTAVVLFLAVIAVWGIEKERQGVLLLV